MRMPKPRLRQVFEHSTHFKVVSPGGKTITIAKKPLSQGMLGRLRRYAQGGEVQNFQIGGEAQDTQPEQMGPPEPVNAAGLTASQEREIIEEHERNIATANARDAALDNQAEAEAVNEVVPEPLTRSSGPVRVPVAAPVAPIAPTAPVNITIQNTPSAPAAPAAAAEPEKTPKPARAEAKPAAEKAAPAPAPAAAPAPVAAPPQRVVQPVATPVGDVVPSAAPRAWQAYQQLGPITAEPGALAGGLAARLQQPVPAALAPAAPVAAPVAPVAAAVAPAGPLPPSPLQAPIPAAPEFKSVTVSEVRKEIKRLQAAQPQASVPALIQTAVSNLTGGLTLPPLKLQEISDLSAQEPEQVFNEAIRDQINAVQEQAKVSYQLATEEADLAAERQRAALAKATQQQIDLEALEAHGKDVYEDAKNNDDIKSFWAGQGFWRSLLGIASLVVSGYTSGYAGTKNFAYDAFENAVARDIEEQKRKRTMRWKNYEQILGDVDDAKKLYGADLKEVSAAELERVAKTSAVGAVGPKFNELVAKIRESAAKDRMSIALKERGAEAKEITAEAAKIRASRPAAVRAPAAPKGPSEATELRRDVYERARTLNVGDVPVQRNTAERASAVGAELANRNFANESLSEVVSLFKKHGDKAWDILSKERGQMIARLGLAIENFPQAFGYGRAVSVNAGRILKGAINDPAGIKAGFLQLIGDRPRETGLQTLLDETRLARRKFVEGLADTVLRDREAAQYGLWKLESAEAKTLGIKPPEKPRFTLPESELLQTPYQRRITGTPATAPAPASAPAVGAAPTGGGWRSVAKAVK